jgi:GT2 family glycosyltransferase
VPARTPGRRDVGRYREGVTYAAHSQEPEGTPCLSVVLVSWNCRGALARCIESLIKYTVGVDFEIVVVDNASSDGTVEYLRRSWPDVRVLVNDANVGFAKGCNQGMAVTRGELVLLLNSDTYVEDNVIGRAVAALRERPEIGMLGCRLTFPDGRLQHTANRALTIRRTLLERLWLYKLVPRARRARLLLGGYWDHDEEAEVDWLAGAFMLIRRSICKATGGFDERFWMYGEDSEWCMRLRRLGHRILFTPEPGTVVHSGSVSADVVWTEKERLRRCHQGGIESYAALNGELLAACYRLAELIGSAARVLAYSAANAVRPRRYYAQQARFYRWLIEFYARPSRQIQPSRTTEPG